MLILVTAYLPFGKLAEFAAVENEMLATELATHCYVDNFGGRVKGSWLENVSYIEIATKAMKLMSMPGVSRVEITFSKG